MTSLLARNKRKTVSVARWPASLGRPRLTLRDGQWRSVTIRNVPFTILYYHVTVTTVMRYVGLAEIRRLAIPTSKTLFGR